MKLEREQIPQLTCPIVRDLLPLYVEGLTSLQTNRAIEAHLEHCPDCTQEKELLTAPLPSPSDRTEKEPDYLKAIRRRGVWRTVIAVVSAMALLLAAVGVKTFFIGSPAQAESMFWTVEQHKEDSLTVRIGTDSSAIAFRGWQMEQQGTTIAIYARQTLASALLGGSGHMDMDIPLDGISRVELCGVPIWQEGISIPRETWLAYQAATPYLGNASALGRLAQALNINLLCGDFTTSLQTNDHPYCWTLHFSQIPRNAQELDRQMEQLSYQMLALVGNLEQVRWTYPQVGGQQVSRVLTLYEAEYRLANYCNEQQDLKAYAKDPVLLELLRQTVTAEDFPIYQ